MSDAAPTPAPHGWVWLDDDGWEHSASEQHPQDRGEAEYGDQFRPATAEEAASPAFLRCPEVHRALALDYVAVVPSMTGGWIKVAVLKEDER